MCVVTKSGQICCICEFVHTCACTVSVSEMCVCVCVYVCVCLCKAQVKAGGLMAIDTNDILMLSVPAHHSPPNLFLLSTLRSVCVCVCVCVCASLLDLLLLYPSSWQVPSDLEWLRYRCFRIKNVVSAKMTGRGDSFIFRERSGEKKEKKKRKDISVILKKLNLMKFSQQNKRIKERDLTFFFFFFKSYLYW